MPDEQFAADDGFYVEVPSGAGSTTSVIDPDQDLGDDESVVVLPLFPPEWIEHEELGLPGPIGQTGPRGAPSFLILNPGDEIPPNTPPSVVYRIRG